MPETPIDPRRGVPSCSALERLDACPASFGMSKDLPDETSDVAEAGTRMHAALETGNVEGLSADELETVERCNEQAANVIQEWKGQSEGSAERLHEVRLGMTTLGGVIDVTEATTFPVVVTGQADVVMVHGDRGLVLDYKTGRGEVSHAAGNAQLRGLAALSSLRWRLSSVRVAIVQPWRGPPTVADFDAATLAQSRAWLTHVLAKVRDATPEDAVAGEHCKYCRAKAICPGFRGEVLTPVQSLAVSLPADKDKAKAALFARAMDLPTEELAGLYEGLKMVGWYVSAIEGAMRKRVEDGEVDGYMLKPGVVRESVADVGKVWGRCEALGVTAADFTGACTITKSNLEGLVRKATGTKGKALKAALSDVLADAVEAKETARQIVRSSS